MRAQLQKQRKELEHVWRKFLNVLLQDFLKGGEKVLLQFRYCLRPCKATHPRS